MPPCHFPRLQTSIAKGPLFLYLSSLFTTLLMKRIMQDVALHQRELATDGIEQGPLIVHCGAGIGRTAVFIVIDILLQLITYQGGCEHVCTLKSATETVHCFGVCLNIWHCEDKPEHVTKCVHI